MDTKDHVVSASPSASFNLGDKLETAHIEDTHLSKKERVAAVDAIASDPHVTSESFAHLDIKKIRRKMDIRIVPTLTCLYLLSFLDRGNIGNAKIEGLSEDLHLTPGQYNWCLVSSCPV